MENLGLYWERLRKGCKHWSLKSARFFCVLLVNIYRSFLSGYTGGNCRYFPSCSKYALEVLEKKSLRQALMCLFFRLIRCHPFSRRGWYDPIDSSLSSELNKKG